MWYDRDELYATDPRWLKRKKYSIRDPQLVFQKVICFPIRDRQFYTRPPYHIGKKQSFYTRPPHHIGKK